ncbi:glycosyltransferase family 2 protein [Limosilactobacillus reuteri]|uniref:glycosyltransferase family 2 protein n=1 Tax=Limosilactobacillus reuteri TaxID=1598 RepID=UPI001E2F87A6|nr:glycosyltransferase family 2 protein [Limosilactobacillus reuteri]MCC4344803.1 glycosyltransferase family 2 protein [Limosilactobacillus reuteri]MCC4357095.1 glycosyltransferase family 2 protein [Limosilactobacillus reuteri]
MNNAKILTISVAAYNVEKTLDKTLESCNDPRIRSDIEVLVVDDGSKDNTKEVAKKYEKIAPNTFKYVQKENGGHGSTINKGIELASGKYFKVIDGDDWVDTNALVKFVDKLKRLDSDMVLTNHVEVYPNRTNKVSLIKRMNANKEYTWDNKIDIKRVVLHTLTVKTELLKKNNVHITENCFYVDVEYVVWATYVSKTITYLDTYLYMYRLGNCNQSVDKNNMLKNIEMQEKVSYQLVRLYDRFTENGMKINQDSTIFNTFKRSIGSTMRTYLLLNTREAKKKITDFDQKIYNISEVSYRRLNDDKFVRLIRSNNYAMIPLVKILYRIWVLKYGY